MNSEARASLVAHSEEQAPAWHRRLSDVGHGLRWEGLPESVRQAARMALLDFVGVAVAAATEQVAAACLRATEVSSGRCTVIGSRQRRAPAAAASVNATLGHAYDYDDVYLPGAAHYSTVLIPASLALAEQVGAPGARVLEALVAGNEVAGRIALATKNVGAEPGIGIRQRGFFPTSVGGSVAAAVASAKVLDLDADQSAHALGLGMNFAGGLASIGHGDNNSKCLLAGWAARSGVEAACHAQAGFTCQREVAESIRGFFNAFSPGTFRADALMRGRDQAWVVESLSYKLYPVEYVVHPLVELALQARDVLGKAVSRIGRIDVSCYSGYALFEPSKLKHAPPDGYAAVFSAPYCIARALSKPRGGLVLADFTEDYVCDEPLRALAARVHFLPDADYDRDFPDRVGARMTIFDESSAVLFKADVPHPYGTPERPLAYAQLLEKFHHNCRAWPPARRERLLALIAQVESAPDAGWISALGEDG